MKSFKHLYELTFRDKKDLLHFAAHSHHPWPDCTLKAQEQYWLDSAHWLDEKWTNTFTEVIPKVQNHISRILNLAKPAQIAIAPNTHEFVLRLFSCFDFTKQVKILTTDSEFHSFRRQLLRYQELSNVQVDIVNVEPYDSFENRWCEKIKNQKYDFIFTSQVFFNSGLECTPLEKWVPYADKKTVIAIDGYHAFCAIPTDLRSWQDRIFYLAGGYKYAQAGEGVCFMSVPAANGLRPLNTGWFADFEALSKPDSKKMNYAKDGMQFAGSTFDASGCYRFNSVFKMLAEQKISIEDVHLHVMELKKYFIEKIQASTSDDLNFKNIIFQNSEMTNAHFVTFRTPKAHEIEQRLCEEKIIADSRGDRLRFGFGLYHDMKDIDSLVNKLSRNLFIKKNVASSSIAAKGAAL